MLSDNLIPIANELRKCEGVILFWYRESARRTDETITSNLLLASEAGLRLISEAVKVEVSRDDTDEDIMEKASDVVSMMEAKLEEIYE
jgi:hypothetical protein|tara:strand:+ start:1884 stop:2147 length:264 start_codon:yes stop_codon:yes gene_type:complete